MGFGHVPVLVTILLVAAMPAFFADDDDADVVDEEALELPVLADPLPC